MTNIRDDIADLIRRVDGDNLMRPDLLGRLVGQHLATEYDVEDMTAGSSAVSAVAAFVERFNPDKVLSAGALADAIVDEFHLDEEN